MMENEPPTFEIAAINPASLTLRKQHGVWNFPLRDALKPGVRELLTARQRENPSWETLGFAVMERLGEKGLRLVEVRL